jgi:hypothetical protein
MTRVNAADNVCSVARRLIWSKYSKNTSEEAARQAADRSAFEMPLVTSALFCGTEPARL